MCGVDGVFGVVVDVEEVLVGCVVYVFLCEVGKVC